MPLKRHDLMHQASRRARRILVELHHLARLLGEGRCERLTSSFPINIQVNLVPVRGGPSNADVMNLIESLKERLQSISINRGRFRSGRIHCFQCDSEECSHELPKTRSETFIGYSPTGKPVFGEFTNLLVERRDPRIDSLFRDPPEPVTLLMGPDELKGELLPGFGRENRSFDVMGQVVVGLFHLEPLIEAADRLAFTVQVVHSRDSSSQLNLNLLGLSEDEVAYLATAKTSHLPAEWLRRAIMNLRCQLDALASNVRTAEQHGQHFDLSSEVMHLLQRFSADFERALRRDRRRTAHGRHRHLQGVRPTACAMRDVREMGVEHFMHDTERDTVVVLGPHGRTHIFTTDGRHVTSLVLGKGELDRKFQRSRWKPMQPDAVSSFRALLRKQ